VGAHAGVGTIRLSARREGATLHLSVDETHTGALRGTVSDGAGIALETLRELLAKRYGEEAALTLDVREGGSTVRVRLPLELDNQRLTPAPSAPLTQESPTPP
jgi:LytS/YehU family sensor histidine kinase